MPFSWPMCSIIYPGQIRIIRHSCLRFKIYAAGLKNVQDPVTGMWCQVVDKCGQPGNWNETSGTGMFLYLIKKAIEKGYIKREEFDAVVKKAYEGIVKKAKTNSKGFIDIYDCSSIGIMDDYQYVYKPAKRNKYIRRSDIFYSWHAEYGRIV